MSGLVLAIFIFLFYVNNIESFHVRKWPENTLFKLHRQNIRKNRINLRLCLRFSLPLMSRLTACDNLYFQSM